MPDMKYRGSSAVLAELASNRSTNSEGVRREGYRKKGTIEDAALPLLRE